MSAALVRRYYDELWNQWRLELADELLAPDIQFRGSLAVEVRGIAGFKEYVRLVQAAFPDFRNSVDELLEAGDQVVARLTYRGDSPGPAVRRGADREASLVPGHGLVPVR